MVQALGLASFAPSGRSDLKRIFTGAPDTKLRRPDDLRLPTSGSQDAWRKICCGQWEGPCPACDEGTDRFRIHLDGTIWCRVCAPDGDPDAFATLCEAAGLPMPGAHGGDTKPAFDDYNGAALAEALDMLGVDIRYDIRAHREQYRRGSGRWEHLTDNHEAKLRDQLATRFHIRKACTVGPFRFSGEKWKVAYGATLARREVDPFLEWLDELDEWDGTERVELLLHDMEPMTDPPSFSRWAGFRQVADGSRGDSFP